MIFVKFIIVLAINLDWPIIEMGSLVCHPRATPSRGYRFLRGHGSTVGIVTGYRLDDWRVEVRVPVGSRLLTSLYRPDWLWGPPNFISNGYLAFSLGVKWQSHEADHSPPTSAEVKKMWIYTSTPPYTFMV
jgi:hypothetical protein